MPARNHFLVMVLSLCRCVPAAGSGVTLSLSSDGRFFTIDGTLDDCVPIQTEGPVVPAMWRDRKVLPKGTTRLEFEFTRASLFGFSAIPTE